MNETVIIHKLKAMQYYIFLVVLMGLSAGFAYINHRFIKMPFVIGLFFLASLLSVLILCGKFFQIQQYVAIRAVVAQVNISGIILDALLGFLLFAGAMHTDWQQIKAQSRSVGLFAIVGVMVSTVLVAGGLFGICRLFSIEIPWLHCLVFGALISPTDPIAVLGIFTKAGVSKKLEGIIVGESLFNDGIGVVLFLALLGLMIPGSGGFNLVHFGSLLLQETVGGLVFGALLGYFLHLLLKSIDHYETEVLLTIAFVMVGYLLCNKLHVSGALAMVVMGLFVGNYRKQATLSSVTITYMHKFWELVDVILNALLFIMIAFVLVLLDLSATYIIIGILTIAVVLLARVLVVFLPVLLVPQFIRITFTEAKLLVWGGLRGGLSLALVLSLPEGSSKQLLVVCTYICVVFSIMVQGLTISKTVKLLGVGKQ